MKELDYDIIVAGGGTAGTAAAIAAARRGWHVLLVIALPCLGRTRRGRDWQGDWASSLSWICKEHLAA